MNTAVAFRNVTIIFGSEPAKALPLADEGQSRAEIQAATGQVLGVHDCTLDVGEGEIVVLMGLSGSGKSTLLRAVNGLNPVTRGAVEVRGKGGMTDVAACSPAALREIRRNHVAMVFQQFGLLPWRSVAENVGFGLELSGLPRRERAAKVAEQLDLVGLTDWKDRRVGELSGGMQQRVGLARAFATEAPILLMDEPFSALDPLIRTRLQDELIELQRKLKRTILFVSHDLDEAFKIGDRIAIMEGGRIVQAGRPRDIYTDPKDGYVADFVAHMNPLGVLTARDVMEDGPPPDGRRVSAATLMILVTGGAGFIGSNFVLNWLANCDAPVLNVDKLTYAGNLENLASLQGSDRHRFVQADICEQDAMLALLREHRPRAILHFAAESHVDRSISGPGEFIRTNIHGTFALLEAARAWYGSLDAGAREAFRFLHVSTDEVFGSLGPDDPAFCETTPYAPNSPYSASKAASDHLVRAYHHTYGLPTLTTNCSNNYGPYQFPEKLIPLMILNALAGERLPVYGDGQNVRDWLYVGDHCSGIARVLERGRLGETYTIGGNNEMKNLEVVHVVCAILDELRPRSGGGTYAEQIRFVTDRPGHDRRYAIDASRMRRELDWQPAESFETGIRKTVRWYLDNPQWIEHVKSGAYRNWLEAHYAERS